MTRVSVALSTYSGAAYLEDQLRSILGQSRPVDEIVVSDDASPDATIAVAERVLAGAGPDVRILRHTDNVGVTRNFERALRATTGDVVLLSDQDDVWHPERVALSLAALDADPGVLLVHGDARRVGTDGTPLRRGLFDTLRVTRGEFRELATGRALRTFLRRNLATGATVALRRRLVDRAVPFPDAWVHDEWLAIVAAATGDVRVLRTPLIDYRQHEANQIGADELTLATGTERLTIGREERNARLLRRAEQLRDWVAGRAESDLRAGVLAEAEGKLAHERARSAYPAHRLARLRPVLRELATGRYSRYGRARFDVPRDLLQPARETAG